MAETPRIDWKKSKTFLDQFHDRKTWKKQSYKVKDEQGKKVRFPRESRKFTKVQPAIEFSENPYQFFLKKVSVPKTESKSVSEDSFSKEIQSKRSDFEENVSNFDVTERNISDDGVKTPPLDELCRKTMEMIWSKTKAVRAAFSQPKQNPVNPDNNFTHSERVKSYEVVVKTSDSELIDNKELLTKVEHLPMFKNQAKVIFYIKEISKLEKSADFGSSSESEKNAASKNLQDYQRINFEPEDIEMKFQEVKDSPSEQASSYKKFRSSTPRRNQNDFYQDQRDFRYQNERNYDRKNYSPKIQRSHTRFDQYRPYPRQNFDHWNHSNQRFNHPHFDRDFRAPPRNYFPSHQGSGNFIRPEEFNQRSPFQAFPPPPRLPPLRYPQQQYNENFHRNRSNYSQTRDFSRSRSFSRSRDYKENNYSEINFSQQTSLKQLPDHHIPESKEKFGRILLSREHPSYRSPTPISPKTPPHPPPKFEIEEALKFEAEITPKDEKSPFNTGQEVVAISHSDDGDQVIASYSSESPESLPDQVKLDQKQKRKQERDKKRIAKDMRKIALRMEIMLLEAKENESDDVAEFSSNNKAKRIRLSQMDEEAVEDESGEERRKKIKKKAVKKIREKLTWIEIQASTVKDNFLPPPPPPSGKPSKNLPQPVIKTKPENLFFDIPNVKPIFFIPSMLEIRKKV